jgi:hypothetical protein
VLDHLVGVVEVLCGKVDRVYWSSDGTEAGARPCGRPRRAPIAYDVLVVSKPIL